MSTRLNKLGRVTYVFDKEDIQPLSLPKQAVALDLDGVITNFCLGFSKVVKTLDPRAPLVTSYDEVMDWQWLPWYWKDGFSQSLNDAAWKHIFHSKDFWESLEPLFPDDMMMLAEIHRDVPVVFMTRRDGLNPWGQTIRWLHRYGIHEPLLVRLGSGEEKADWCRKLGCGILIDDSPKNLELARVEGIYTIAMSWPFNEDNLKEGKRVTADKRVRSLREALEAAYAIA